MTPDDLVEEENCVCVPNDVSVAVLPSSVTLDVLLVEQNSFALERSVGDPVHPVVGSLKRCPFWWKRGCFSPPCKRHWDGTVETQSPRANCILERPSGPVAGTSFELLRVHPCTMPRLLINGPSSAGS
uniref:Uncharacterized protein n=1 Tax=Knipowitschia caucasica TaxID=637954 RepID=A0AAV2MHH6_KNICA